jgi:hypothetical protein
MFAENSPRFAARFPEIANTFDNLHMLHDLVNDALASDWMSETQKEEQIQRAIWLVMAANHEGMEAGKTYGANKLHDHRFMEGMPGMGWMGDIEGVEHLNHGQNNSESNMMNHQMNHQMNHGENKPGMMNHQMNHGENKPGMMNHQMDHGEDTPGMMNHQMDHGEDNPEMMQK